MSKIYDVVIIGGGPIGIFSLFGCGIEGLSCAIIDSNSQLGGQCIYTYPSKKIYDVPAHKEITGAQLIHNLLDQVSVFKYDSFLNFFVSSINEKNDVFVIKDSDIEIHSKTVIVALGSGIYKPVKMSISHPKELEGDRILYSIDDSSRFFDKKVAILGGGDSALDWALQLTDVCSLIYLIHRRECFRSNNYNVSKVEFHPKIIKKAPFSLEKIEYNNDKLILFGETKIEVDFVLPFYGVSSNLNFLANWNLKLVNSKILVDSSNMSTSRSNVYAIGDCVFYEGKRNLILTGFSEAMIATRDIFKELNPTKAFNTTYSTHSKIFKS